MSKAPSNKHRIGKIRSSIIQTENVVKVMAKTSTSVEWYWDIWKHYPIVGLYRLPVRILKCFFLKNHCNGETWNIQFSLWWFCYWIRNFDDEAMDDERFGPKLLGQYILNRIKPWPGMLFEQLDKKPACSMLR